MIHRYARMQFNNAAPYILVDGVGLVDTGETGHDRLISEGYYRIIGGRKILVATLLKPRMQWMKDLHRGEIAGPVLLGGGGDPFMSRH